MNYYNLVAITEDSNIIIDLETKQAVYETSDYREAVELIDEWDTTRTTLALATQKRLEAELEVSRAQNACTHTLKNSESWSSVGDPYSADIYGTTHVCTLCNKHWREQHNG